MLGARAIANLSMSADGRSVVSAQANDILGFLERVTGIQGGEVIGKFNRNVLIAISTVSVNLSVLVSRENLLAPQQRRRLMAILGAILSEQSDSEVLYRSLVALGTLLSAGAGPVTEGLDVRSWVQTASDKGTEDRVKQLARECAKFVSR
jgi:phospholipase A-2-activating protein